MLKPLLIAPIAFVGLTSASPPPMGHHAMAAGQDYPPCSATITDRCTQTYERGRHRHGMREREAYGPPPPPIAGPAPVQVAGDYPPCSATVTDRCRQRTGARQAPPTRYAAWERQRIRVGERG